MMNKSVHGLKRDERVCRMVVGRGEIESAGAEAVFGRGLGNNFCE
jgi:hypothetical protein